MCIGVGVGGDAPVKSKHWDWHTHRSWVVNGHPESPLFGAIKFDTPGPGVLVLMIFFADAMSLSLSISLRRQPSVHHPRHGYHNGPAAFRRHSPWDPPTEVPLHHTREVDSCSRIPQSTKM